MIIRGDKNPFLRGKTAKKHIKAFLSQAENPFSGMSDTTRAAAIAKFATAHSENFSNSLARLKEICRDYNFFQLLAHFAYYDQILLDAEKNDTAYKPVEQSGTELLQALILQIAEDDLSIRLETPPPPEVLLETNKLLRGITNSFCLKRYGSPITGTKSARLLSEMVRSHTAAVRNEGFPSQIRRTMTELVAPLDSAFEKKRGLKLTCLSTMLWNAADLVGKRINDDFQKRRAILGLDDPDAIVEGFAKLDCRDEGTAKAFCDEMSRANMSIGDIRGYLTTLWDKTNFKLFCLSLDDWIACYPAEVKGAVIEWVLTQWSLSLGSLQADNPEYFFLDNPVWAKPIINFGPGRFLLAIPGLVQSFGQRLLEAVIQTEAELWEKYRSKVRPKYLAAFVARLLSSALPSGKVLVGVVWVHPISGKRFETDLLVIFDTHALIIECKAGRITGRARRGDTARLETEIDKLIAEPTLQGQRFSDFLSTANGPVEVEDAKGAKHVIETKQLNRISRINVTMDCFGPVGIQARMLREAGMVSKDLKPAATFHLHELENIFEILDRPAFLFHYLHRRAEIEGAIDLLSNEGSLLAMYLATGFDLGDFEDAEPKVLALPTMDGELEPYFWGKELHRPIPKPKRRLTKWWRDILSSLERRAGLGWMESLYGLLSVGYERQKEFERGVKRMLKEVKSNWHNPEHQNVCFLVAGSPKQRVTVMCVGVKNVNLEQQRETVTRAFDAANEKEPTSATLAIVKSASTQTYPYSAIYLLQPELDEGGL